MFTYYSQNYAGIIGAGLISVFCDHAFSNQEINFMLKLKFTIRENLHPWEINLQYSSIINNFVENLRS